MTAIKTEKPKLLVCDDDESIRLALKTFLSRKFDILTATNGDEALHILDENLIEMLLLDINLRWENEGLEYMPKFLKKEPELSIIMISGRREFEVVREAMRQGASDYIDKDAEPEEWLLNLDRAFERRRLFLQSQRSNRELCERVNKENELIGKSQAILNLKALVQKIRNAGTNVVIHGETGTGKEVIARQLRAMDKKGRLEPFVPIDSATIQGTMAESILFGHEKGAFTGAFERRKGAFEEADQGSIYLDEVTNMPLEIQRKLLRVLQEKEVRRLGSSKVIHLNFRVVCATNRPLEKMIKEGKFLEDLYQRLNVIPIYVPPLRDRIEDLPLLLNYFVDKHAQGGRALEFSEDAISVLKTYPWLGNVRELQNLVAYLSVVSDMDVIEISDLPPKFREATKDAALLAGKSKTSFYEKVAAFEKEFLLKEYRNTGGNVSMMAKNLKMDRSHLYAKLKIYGIHSKKRSTELTATSSAAV